MVALRANPIHTTAAARPHTRLLQGHAEHLGLLCRLRVPPCASLQVWRSLTNDGQLCWIGPEKGPVHQAAAGILNALWDLWGRYEGKPVWQLVCDMSPEQIVGLLDFTYVEDVLTRDEATAILQEAASTKDTRAKEMKEVGFPAYTTSTGWAGYPDEKVTTGRLCSLHATLF